ncbi:MAG: ferredoxin family protein [Candidatus Binatia bacterium]
MPIDVFPQICTSCRLCYEECPVDLFTWDEASRLPVVSYLEECFYCNVCEVVCPTDPKAIRVSPPLISQVVGWKHK